MPNRLASHCRAAVPDLDKREFPYPDIGDYRAWPGPFEHVCHGDHEFVTETAATLPPTAIGKDFPIDSRWIGLSP